MSEDASTSSVGDALRARALDDPACDEPRLVYADWCDEHGRAAEARCIRLQCAQARAPLPDPAGIAEVESSLPLANDEDERSLPASLAVFDWEVVYHRGLPWRLDLRTLRSPSAAVWLARLERLATRFPQLASITLQAGYWEELDGGRPVVARLHELWPRLDSVGLHGFELDARILESVALVRPRRLTLVGRSEDAVVCAELDEALGAMIGLEALHLGSTGGHFEFGAEFDIARIARTLKGLRELRLTRLSVEDPSDLAPLVNLERLTLHSVHEPDGLRELSHLPLRDFQVASGDDLLLGALPAWARLRSLRVGERNPVRPTVSARGLATMKRFPLLGRLEVDGVNDVGGYVAAANAAPALVQLSLDAPLSNDDADAIASLAQLQAVSVRHPRENPGIYRLLESLPSIRAVGLHVFELHALLRKPLAGSALRALFLAGSSAQRMTTEGIAVVAELAVEQIAFDASWGLRVYPAWLRAAFPRTRLVSFAQAARDGGRPRAERSRGLSLSVGLSRGGAVRAFHPRFEDWAPVEGELPGRAIESATVRNIRSAE